MDCHLSRMRKFTAWMKKKDICYRIIGAALGCSWQRARYVINSDTITPVMFEKFTKIGIPAEFLPPVVPPRRIRQGKL